MKKIARRVQQVKRSIFDADRVVVYHGDCLKVMASIPEASVDTIVTDPPYELGFMSKKWDNSGVAFDPETWRVALRVAKPGAHLLAFGGTRTFHRLACAIEDAGWEIRDCLMWVYGSGFPKSLDVSKAIDKAAGADREVVGNHRRSFRPHADSGCDGWLRPSHEVHGDITAPATDAAKQWAGWGTALKPAWEPIVLARKPLDGTVAECALQHGTGALNVDGCRIGTEQRTTKGMSKKKSACAGTFRDNSWEPKDIETTQTGRWPANAVFQHDVRCVRVGEQIVGQGDGRTRKQPTKHDAPVKFGYSKERVQSNYGLESIELWACVPDCPVRMLDGQSGRSKSPSGIMHRTGKGIVFQGGEKGFPYQQHGDSGGASRFFYTAKASTTERVLGCPPGYENRHPTVKPLDLCRWLCRLTKTPDGGVVLDPFSGSGSIAVAALLEGRRAIAIELEEESANVTVARVQAALKYGEGLQNLKRYKLNGRKKLKRRR